MKLTDVDKLLLRSMPPTWDVLLRLQAWHTYLYGQMVDPHRTMTPEMWGLFYDLEYVKILRSEEIITKLVSKAAMNELAEQVGCTGI